MEVFLVKWNIRGNWCAINAWPPLSESGEHDVQQWNRCMRSISILESVRGMKSDNGEN